jgi:hypothetical protein
VNNELEGMWKEAVMTELELLVRHFLDGLMKTMKISPRTLGAPSEMDLGSSRIKPKTNSVALVRKRTIPTERPPLVGEVSTNF